MASSVSRRETVKNRRIQRKSKVRWYMFRTVFWLLVTVLCFVMFLLGFVVGRWL